jgi:hypothetical protein
MRRAPGIHAHERWPGGIRRRAAIFGSLSVALLISPILELVAAGPRIGTILGVDYQLYVDATARWLSGGAFYPAYELAGPFLNTEHDVLYPPTAILLFAPFTVLPAALWWAIPIGVVAAVSAYWRPDPVIWPFLAICLAWPATPLTIVVGNPVLWFTAALALATIHRWPAAFILVKPSLLPFAFFGAWRRSWWLACGALAVLSLPFVAMWGDWLRVVSNSPHGLFHSVQQIPLLLIPLLVWLGRTRPEPARQRHELRARAPLSERSPEAVRA